MKIPTPSAMTKTRKEELTPLFIEATWSDNTLTSGSASVINTPRPKPDAINSKTLLFCVIIEPRWLPTGKNPTFTPRRKSVNPITTRKAEKRNCKYKEGVKTLNIQPRIVAIRTIGSTDIATSFICLKKSINLLQKSDCNYLKYK